MSKPKKIILWGEPEIDSAHRAIDELPKDGAKPWQLTIKRFYESPSDQQRGYYRSTIIPMLCQHVEDCGQGRYSHEAMHEWLKQEFGPPATVEVNGVAHEVVDFTTGDKGEMPAMSAYIDKILNWASRDLGLYIPPPKKHETRKRTEAA